MTDLPGMWEESDLINGEADMTDTQEAMREEFEKIYLGSKKKRKDGEYAIPSTRNAFLLYQAYTAQSAAKIANLKADVEHYKQISHVQEHGWEQDRKRAAAAELSNKQLRELLQAMFDSFADYVEGGKSDELMQQISKALAQQPSTEALDAYVAKLHEWQPIETAPYDVVILLTDGKMVFDGYRETLRMEPTHWMPLPPAPKE